MSAPSGADSWMLSESRLLAGYAAHGSTVSIVMGGHNLRVINRWYTLFDGDLDLPLIALAVWLDALGGMDAAGCGHEALDPAATAQWSAARPYPRVRLSETIAAPRESARRRLATLIGRGWLAPVGRRGVAVTLNACERLGLQRSRWVLDDFLWTAGRVRDALTLPDRPDFARRLRAELSDAIQTRDSPAAASGFSIDAEPAPQVALPTLVPAATLALELGRFAARHLLRLRPIFDDDLVLPLLLGEVSSYTFSALLRSRDVDLSVVDAAFGGDPDERARLFGRLLRPCNAHSLALATGVPETTVRRKLAELVRRGWLHQPDPHGYLTRPALARVFADINLETARDFLETGARLRAQLA